MADVEGKKLTELRVIDLKTELERRGLDKTGNKAALLDRLSKAIIEEGEDPEEYLIVPSGGVKASPKKTIDTSILIEEALEVDSLQNEMDDQKNKTDDQKTEVDNEKNDEICDQKNEIENTLENVDNSESNPADTTEELIINISAQPEELEMEYQETEQESAVVTEEPIPEKKAVIPEDESSNVSAVETNGIDNEDSINLTIGEDEENLLVEETESNDILKDGEKKRSEESNIDTSDNNNDADNDSNDIGNINKKGDSKGNGRAETSANKEGTSTSTSSSTSGPNTISLKSKMDGEGCKSSDVTAKGSKKEEKDKAFTVSPNASSRNLWVSGLSSTTRATDLKQIFSKYGKVIGAKVVTNARTPGARCYGYVTMSTSDDAEKCIEHLHRTELHGRVISVEKAKGDSQQSHSRKRELTGKADKKDEKEKTKEQEEQGEKEEAEKNDDNAVSSMKKRKEDESGSTKEGDDEKAETEDVLSLDREKRESSLDNKEEAGSLKDCDTRSNKSSSKKSDRERGNSREDKKRSWDRSRTSRSKSRERHRRDNEERERQRLREKERLLREEKRRRREDMERQRAIEREAARLEREREKLRLERERIEQEKAELLRLERERQKLEREKLERERLELKRQQLRLEENRRPPGHGPAAVSSSAALKRTASDRPPRDFSEPDRKRMNPANERGGRHSPPERVSDGRHGGASVPPRYENPRSKEVGMPKNFKRQNDFPARNSRDDHYEMTRPARDNIIRRDTRPNQSSMDHRGAPPKERYERPSGFGRDREVHRSDDNHRSSRDNHARYDNSKSSNPHNRQTGWHSGPPSKPFNSVNNRNEQSGWNSRSSDSRVNSRWNSNMGGNNMGHPRSQMYQGGGGGGGPSQSYGMSQGNSGSYERFDPYKGSMQNMRKY